MILKGFARGRYYQIGFYDMRSQLRSSEVTGIGEVFRERGKFYEF
jgi:hypothetical protein